MDRFVILRHTMPSGSPRPNHWDLMLQSGPVLRTWALDTLPLSGAIVIAQRLPDHRLAYLDYEGAISNGRGEVQRWDRGQLHWEIEGEAELLATLAGEHLRGRIRLTAVESSSNWRLEYVAEIAQPGGMH